MPEIPIPYFIIVVIFSTIIISLFFLFQKNKIIKQYKQTNSQELKNIRGFILSDKGFLSWGLHLGTFDIIINDNSIFLFLKNLSFIPSRNTNLLFSNSDRRNTFKVTLLREYKIDNNSLHMIYYPDHLMNRSRKIVLKNLNPEQLSIFEKTFEGKSRRIY